MSNPQNTEQRVYMLHAIFRHPEFDNRADDAYDAWLNQWHRHATRMVLKERRLDKAKLRRQHPEVYAVGKGAEMTEEKYEIVADRVLINWIFDNILSDPIGVTNRIGQN